MVRGGTRGYTLLEVMIVVFIIGVLAIICIPAFRRARQNAQSASCMDNLRQIDSAKEQFAIENNKVAGDAVAEGDIDPYLKRGFGVLVEPTGGSYTYADVGEDPTCSNYDGDTHPATL